MNNLKIRDNFFLKGRKDTRFLWLYRRDVTVSSYVKTLLYVNLMFIGPCIIVIVE